MGNPWDFSGTINQAADARDRQGLYNLQMQELLDKQKERQGLEAFRSGWPSYLQQNQGSLQPTTTTSQIPLGQSEVTGLANVGAIPEVGAGEAGAMGIPAPELTKDVTSTVPAKETEMSLYGKYAMKTRPELGIPIMQEARKQKQEEFAELTKALETLHKLKVEGDDEMAKSYRDMLVKQHPELAFLKNTTTKTSSDKRFSIIEIKDDKGDVIAKTMMDNTTNKPIEHWIKKGEEKGPNTKVELQIAYDKETDPAKKAALKRQITAIEESEIKVGKNKFVISPETSTSDQKNLMQINKEREASGEPTLTMEQYLQGANKRKPTDDSFGFGGKNASATTTPAKAVKDNFGYSVGEVRTVPGKGNYKYIGNNKWQKQ
jgi:hypothetical protein